VKKTLAALAGIALAVLAAGCSSTRGITPDSSTPAACKAALTVQLNESEAGNQAARNAPEPAQCRGLSSAQFQQIAVQVVSAGLQKVLS
jgi:hypothetical protein